MKNLLRALFISVLFILGSLNSAKAQFAEVVIVGPSELCFGECATYELVVIDSFGALVDFAWNVNGITISNQNPITVCADSQNGVDISAFGIGTDITGNIFDFGVEEFVQVAGAVDPIIVSTSALCPTDSLGAGCEKICAFNTATYEATGIPPGTTVTWQVFGAENFTTNGNEITVEWGAPGQGEITATVGGGTAPTEPFQIYCGQLAQVVLPNGVLGGDGYLNIFGGTGPYDVFLSSPLMMQNFNFLNPGSYNFDDLPPEPYQVSVTDANGNSLSCAFEIVPNDSSCWVSAFPNGIQHATTCDDCDGGISVEGLGGFVFSYEWSTGSTTPFIDDLCPGTYSLTITDDLGCTHVSNYIVDCPQGTGCVGEATLCVEILEEPEAAIESTPVASAGGIIEVCQGQTVFFDNASEGATSYAWDFGDLNTSAQFEPSHTYQAAGTYTVQLVAFNDCFCSDTTDITVEVLPAEVPAINCIGTICEGETVTYSTDVMCSSYTWQVTGSANILDGGGSSDNFVTVEWLAGPEGFISLEVAGCAGTICNVPNVIPIPIISDAVQIQGPDKVCEGSTEEYFIPNYQGTEINWSVVGSGTIVEEAGERVTINWFGDAGANNPQLVIVEFENCYLGCSGQDTLEVFIQPSFFVEGPIEVCENSTEDYLSRNTLNGALMLSNWEVFDETSGSVWTSAAATGTASIPWNFAPGKYTVRATADSPSSFCNETYDIFIEIVEAPPAPTAINGEDEICPGETYTYLADGILNNDFTWTVTGGAPTTINGNPANVTWNASGPYNLSVVQIATTGLACTSAPLDLAIVEIPPFDVTGDDEVCREEIGTYSVPFFDGIDYQWSISPAAVGTITSGMGSESIQIQWHASGPATVSVNVCGANESFNVDVLALPEPVPQFPSEICAGETPIVTTSIPYSAYSWKNDAGTQISTVPDPMLGGGHYEVEVTDANSCVGDSIFEIVERDLPEVSISVPAYMPICPGGPSVTIYSVSIGSGGYTYEWFRNGTPIGGNTPDLVTNQEGNYSVIVTDPFGCTATSETETIIDCATAGGTCNGGICSIGAGGGGPGGGGGCASNGNIDFNFAATANCDELAFFNTSVDFVPGSLSWNFDDPASGAANTSTLDNPTHEFTEVGYYTVVLTGSINNVVPGGPPCLDWVFYDVLVPLKANFETNPVCPGDAMEFIDRSVFVTGGSITDWEWDFGDPASGAANTSNLQNPTHTYANSGTYTVTLTLTEASGCQVSTTQTVTVFDLPSVSFPLPSITCENTSLPFDAVVPADFASLLWNFDDPVSGAANTSEVVNTFHEFDVPGPYTVNLGVTSIQGCQNNFSDVVNVTANPLSGLISLSQPSPICEGDSVTLTAPAGGIIWDWTTGNPTDEITVYNSGVYDVTLTDAEGCTYSPPEALVDVLAEPNGIIKAVEYNEFGQPTGFFESPYVVCEGDDVYLVVQGSANNSYSWSTGEPGDEISFTKDKNNELPVGTHTFSVTVTDGLTGCTSEEGPFEIIVNPVPDVMIQSMPNGFLCENEMATLSIVSPDPMLTYQWNTGEVTTSIDVITGGIYFVQATNSFGCKNRSNEIELNNAPDIDLIPTGCFNRCEPDTMCLPPMGLVNSYQWFLDGSPIPAPNGTQEEPIFDQSGEYHVILTDVFGCTSTSGPLNLDLFPGFGDITGNVWYDVNGNGIIDGPDTLLSNVDIILNDGTVNIDTVSSTTNGSYIFVGVGANGYTLELDTTSLPNDWTAYWLDGNVSIIGCDVEESFDWLVVGCIPSIENVALSACEGDGVIFDGTFVPAGTTQNFSYPASSFNGCDSIVIVEVAEILNDTIPLEFTICENETVTYEGVVLSPGDVQDFSFTNFNGCDSTVQVSVLGLPTDTESLTLTTCQGVPVIYDGTPLNIGDVQDFIFQNQNGCDSTVTVTVDENPPILYEQLFEICDGTTIDYEGTTLSPGDVQVFTLIDQSGCDSLVEVTVNGLQNVSELFFFTACPGETIDFNGTQIPAGSQQDFFFQTFQGCDSIVTVTVNASQTHDIDVTLEVCDGETANFNGQVLSAGETATVTLTNQFGCDSTVTATVSALPVVSFDLLANEICWNGNDGEVEVLNISGFSAPYEVSVDGVNYQPELLFENLDPGSYTVFLQDDNDCIFENEIEVTATPPLIVETEDETIECGDLIILNPIIVSEIPHTLTWPDGSTDPTLDVTLPGVYPIIVENACEVVNREIAVTLGVESLRTQIYMPNSFSPNDDGINDCYQGYLAPGTDVDYFLLRIFDRWGNQMFESNDPDACWDGDFRGEPMDPAVFAWFVEMRVRNCDGQMLEYFEEGGIHLMK